MAERIKITVLVAGSPVIVVKDRAPGPALQKLNVRFIEKFRIQGEEHGISR